MVDTFYLTFISISLYCVGDVCNTKKGGLNLPFPSLFVGLLSWNNALFQASARDCANLTCVTQASPSGVPSNKLASK